MWLYQILQFSFCADGAVMILSLNSFIRETGIRAVLNRDLLKLSALRYRGFDGYIASMHQSGNHWIRYVLSTAIARHFGHSDPDHIGDKQYVSAVKTKFGNSSLPRVVVSHRIYSPLAFNAVTTRCLKFPPYVILVRDLSHMLVSNYERFKDRYGVPFSTYLRGDVWGRKYNCDIWDSIRFLNAWGDIRQALPGKTLIVRYEDMQKDVAHEARRIWQFFGLPAQGESLLEDAARDSSKERMQQKEAAAGKYGVIIRQSSRNPLDWYSEADQRYLADVCSRYLKHSFGYDYSGFAGGAVRRAA